MRSTRRLSQRQRQRQMPRLQFLLLFLLILLILVPLHSNSVQAWPKSEVSSREYKTMIRPELFANVTLESFLLMDKNDSSGSSSSGSSNSNSNSNSSTTPFAA